MFNKKKKNEEKDMENNAAQEPKTDAQEVNTGNQEVNETAENEVNATEPVETLSPEEKLQQEKAELNDKYLRLFAEFDNYKRRTQKERVELLQTAGKDVIVSLLTVLDDFDRAIKATENATEISAIRDGILLVQSKLQSILSQKGLKAIESNEVPFNTDLHEAITNVPAPTEALKGAVIDTVEKGYTLNDKVIRFAKVVVGS